MRMLKIYIVQILFNVKLKYVLRKLIMFLTILFGIYGEVFPLFN